MRVFWDKLGPTDARSGSGNGRNIPERGLKSSECLKPMSTCGVLRGDISRCNLMENFKTGQGLKSRSCGVGAAGSGSAFPAGVDDPKSSRGGTGNFKF